MLFILMLVVVFVMSITISRTGQPGDVNKFWMALFAFFGLADCVIGAWISALICLGGFIWEAVLLRRATRSLK